MASTRQHSTTRPRAPVAEPNDGAQAGERRVQHSNKTKFKQWDQSAKGLKVITTPCNAANNASRPRRETSQFLQSLVHHQFTERDESERTRRIVILQVEIYPQAVPESAQCSF